jgi:hypothetical protein
MAAPQTIADLIRDPSPIVRAVKLAELLENLVVIIAGRSVPITTDPVTGNVVIDLRNLTSSGIPQTTAFPVADNNGQVLTAASGDAGGVRWV